MKNPKQNLSLKKLQNLWDKKLARSGFQDIEDRKTGLLKSWSGHFPHDKLMIFEGVRIKAMYGYSNLDWKTSQAEYYRRAAYVLHLKKFEDKKEKKIWKAHCEGKSLREISREMKISFAIVRYAIKTLQKEFGLSRLSNNEATEGSDHAKIKSLSNP